MGQVEHRKMGQVDHRVNLPRISLLTYLFINLFN